MLMGLNAVAVMAVVVGSMNTATAATTATTKTKTTTTSWNTPRFTRWPLTTPTRRRRLRLKGGAGRTSRRGMPTPRIRPSWRHSTTYKQPRPPPPLPADRRSRPKRKSSTNGRGSSSSNSNSNSRSETSSGAASSSSGTTNCDNSSTGSTNSSSYSMHWPCKDKKHTPMPPCRVEAMAWGCGLRRCCRRRIHPTPFRRLRFLTPHPSPLRLRIPRLGQPPKLLLPPFTGRRHLRSFT